MVLALCDAVEAEQPLNIAGSRGTVLNGHPSIALFHVGPPPIHAPQTDRQIAGLVPAAASRIVLMPDLNLAGLPATITHVIDALNPRLTQVPILPGELPKMPLNKNFRQFLARG